MIRRIHTTLLLILSPFLLSVALAEAPRSVQFQVYLWPDTPNPNLEAKIRAENPHNAANRIVEYLPPTIQFSPSDGIAVQDVAAAENRLSPTYSFSGAGPLVFFREETLNGEIRRIALGAVNIPPSMERALLLFLPNPDNPDTFRIYPVNNSLAHTRHGHANILNLTGQPIACLFNEQKLVLRPDQQQVVALGAEEKHISIIVRIGAEDENGKWKQRYVHQLAIKPDDSLTILIYKKPDSRNAFRIQRIDNPEGSAPVNTVSLVSKRAES